MTELTAASEFAATALYAKIEAREAAENSRIAAEAVKTAVDNIWTHWLIARDEAERAKEAAARAYDAAERAADAATSLEALEALDAAERAARFVEVALESAHNR